MSGIFTWAFLTVAICLVIMGCGSKPPKAELLSWRTTKLRAGDGGAIQGGEFAIVVKMRATGDKLFISASGSDSYTMKCEDFTLSAPGGQSVTAVGYRQPKDKGEDFKTGTRFQDRPPGDEEVEVLFVVDEKLAGLSDLELHHAGLPRVSLTEEKKERKAGNP